MIDIWTTTFEVNSWAQNSMFDTLSSSKHGIGDHQFVAEYHRHDKNSFELVGKNSSDSINPNWNYRKDRNKHISKKSPRSFNKSAVCLIVPYTSVVRGKSSVNSAILLESIRSPYLLNLIEKLYFSFSDNIILFFCLDF